MYIEYTFANISGNGNSNVYSIYIEMEVGNYYQFHMYTVMQVKTDRLNDCI